MSKLNIDDKKCIHCGACTAACSGRALAMRQEDWTLSYDEALCTRCDSCLSACPLRAITAASL